MKEVIRTIYSVIWDECIDFYKWAHNNVSSIVLIVTAIVLLFLGVLTCYQVAKREGHSWGMGVLFVWLYLLADGTSMFLMYKAHFYYWDDLDNTLLGWLSISILLFVNIMLMIAGIVYRRFIYSLLTCIFVLAACFLLGSYGLWAIIIPLGLGGGSTFVGTFIDRNGNSYDVFKRN